MGAGGRVYVPEPGLAVEARATTEASYLARSWTLEEGATSVGEVTRNRDRGSNALTFPISALLSPPESPTG